MGPGARGAAAPPRAPTWCSRKKELAIAKRLQGERLHRRQAPSPLCFERRERLNEHFNRNALKTPLAQTSPTRPCAQRAILSAFSVTKLLTSHLFLEPTPIPFNLPTPWCQSGASPRRSTGSPPSLPRTRRQGEIQSKVTQISNFSKFKVQSLDIATLLGAKGPQQGPQGPKGPEVPPALRRS